MNNILRYHAALACLLMTFSCGSNEDPIEPTPLPPSPEVEGTKCAVAVDIPLSEGNTTRAHWDADGKKFFWDEDQPLITVIKHDGAIVPYYKLEDVTQANYYSMTSIEINSEDAGLAKFSTQDGLLVTKSETGVTFPVTVGDAVYNLSPVDQNQLNASANGVTAAMPMPNTFGQSAKDDMNGLKDYAYIYATTNLTEVSEEHIYAAGTKFSTAVALVRFKLVSSIKDNTVTKITMAADEGKKIFPNTATWTAGAESPISTPQDNANFYSSISTTIEQGALTEDAVQNYYQFVLPCSESLTNDCVLNFTIETEKINYTYSISTEQFFGQSNTTRTFEAGYIYTFGFKLGEDVQLTDITFSTWGETVFDMEGELVSEVINPEVTSWNETLQPAALMEFVDFELTKIVDGKNYKVLWATSNLGSLTPLGEGGYYAWGATNTDDDPVVKAYGLSGYNWMTPTKEDFLQLIEATTITKEFGTYTPGGNTTQESDAQGVSAWKFSANGKTLYIPVTGYKTDGTIHQEEKGICHYWSGSCTEESKPLGFVTGYQGNQATLPSALTPFTDSRQMAIRPIYLKPINNAN